MDGLVRMKEFPMRASVYLGEHSLMRALPECPAMPCPVRGACHAMPCQGSALAAFRLPQLSMATSFVRFADFENLTNFFLVKMLRWEIYSRNKWLQISILTTGASETSALQRGMFLHISFIFLNKESRNLFQSHIFSIHPDLKEKIK